MWLKAFLLNITHIINKLFLQRRGPRHNPCDGLVGRHRGVSQRYGGDWGEGDYGELGQVQILEADRAHWGSHRHPYRGQTRVLLDPGSERPDGVDDFILPRAHRLVDNFFWERLDWLKQNRSGWVGIGVNFLIFARGIQDLESCCIISLKFLYQQHERTCGRTQRGRQKQLILKVTRLKYSWASSHLHILKHRQSWSSLSSSRKVGIATTLKINYASLINPLVMSHLALAVNTGQRVNIAGAPLAAAGQFAGTQGGVAASTSGLLDLCLGCGGEGITDGWWLCLCSRGFIRGSRAISLTGGLFTRFRFDHGIGVSLCGLFWFLFY